MIAEHLETFLASLDADPDAKGLPAYVQRAFYDALQCGLLAHGVLRLGGDTCQEEILLPLRCKRRGGCPSCAGRRMAQTAAHLVECVIPWVPTRQGVVSGPLPWRYWTAPSKDLMTQVHTMIRPTIAPYYVHQAVKRGIERQKVQPGSGTFIQRCGGAINLNVHSHVDRTDQGRTPRLVKGEPPSDTDRAEVLQPISRRVIRTRRRLGYLEAGLDAAVATGYDPLRSEEPARARPMAASVTQRIAFGERAGQTLRRIGSGFGYAGDRPELTGPRGASVNGFSLHATTQIPAHRRDQLERWMRSTARGAGARERLEEAANGDRVSTFTKPWSDGTTGMKRSPWERLEQLAARVPLPRVHLGRYPGCLAPHSQGRGAILPTPRQQGVDGDEAKTGTPSWSWARLLGRVFALDMATWPWCRRGARWISAASTQEAVITRLLRHLKLASVPPLMAPARSRQARVAWVAEPPPSAGARGRRARRGGVSHPSERLPSRLQSLPPHSRAALRRDPPPACGACPGRAGRRYALLLGVLARADTARWAAREAV